MIAVDVLSDLRHRGVELTVADGVLKYRAPRGVVTPELAATLSAHKAELMALLNPPAPTHRLDPTERLALLDAEHAEVRAEYVDGALPWGMQQADLKRRFDDTETAIDRLAGGNPTEAE